MKGMVCTMMSIWGEVTELSWYGDYKASMWDKIRWKLRDVRWALRTLPMDLKRCWNYSRLVWKFSDADWSDVAEVMRYQIHQLRLTVSHGHNLYRGRDAQRMRIVEVLLTRLIDDNYADMASYRYPKRDKHWVRQWEALCKQDMDMLADILRRHLRSWWE